MNDESAAPFTSASHHRRDAAPFAQALDHFRRIVTMLGLLDRLPDLADDIRVWRPRERREALSDDGLAGLEPVGRHALEALVAGLDMLGVAAATLCENTGGQPAPDEIAACQEIGAAMTNLIERVRALVDRDDDTDLADNRASLFRSFLGERRLNPLFVG